MVLATDYLEELDHLYSSQGDISGKRSPKKYFSRAEGSFLIDHEGGRFLDFQMFNSAANFGYGNPAITESFRNQLDTLPSLASEFMHEERVRLAQRIALSIQQRFGVRGRVHFSVGGAQAIDDALKLVANHTGTRSCFAFEGGYHGRTIAASCLSSSPRYRRSFAPSEKASFVPFPYCYRCAYGKHLPDCDYYCVGQFGRLFESEFHGFWDSQRATSEQRALFAEPVLGRGGYVVPPPEYFSRLKEHLDRHGILLVADEVQMGLFRTGKLWAMEHFGVVPDILVFGKSISNGLAPLSGLWAREELISPEAWPPGSSHATFCAHPLSTAAGLATMEYIEGIDLESITEKAGAAIFAHLLELQSEFKVFGRIQRLGMAFGVEVCQPGTDTPAPLLAKRLSALALAAPLRREDARCGLILTVAGYNNNVLLLSPSLLISGEEIALFRDILQRTLELSTDDGAGVIHGVPSGSH